MSELTFNEILKNQKKTVVKKPSKVKKVEKRSYSDDEAPEEISSKRPKKMKQFFEKAPRTIDPRFSGKFNSFYFY
jgi:hypothetical protein